MFSFWDIQLECVALTGDEPVQLNMVVSQPFALADAIQQGEQADVIEHG